MLFRSDLQEPVRKLILFSNELQEGTLDAVKQDHALSVIKKSSQRIKNLLLNLQNYLSLTVKTTIEDQCNLSEIVEYEMQQLKSSFPEVTVKANWDKLATITGNKNQISWLFHHLLKNAFEHGVLNNYLSLSINSVIVKENLFSNLSNKYAYVEYIKILIKDEGPGFDGYYNNYIFDVLKRLNAKGGTIGFGLAFCRRIVENHRGNIKAEGVAGRGATFTVMLPVDNAL